MCKDPEKNSTNSPFSIFVGKFGLILSKVKDSIVKDILDGLIEENYSWEQFQQDCQDKGTKVFEEFIERIINKLGFDLSSLSEESSELNDLVKSIFATSIKLGDTISDLVSQSDEKDIFTLIEEYQSNESKVGARPDLSTTTTVSAALFGKESRKATFDTDFKGGNASIEIDLPPELSKLMNIIELLQELITLVKKFGDIEWQSIAEDIDEFGEYIKNSYLTEEFAKRIMNYVLILLLKNTKEVFSEDLKNVIALGEEAAKNFLQDHLTGSSAVAVDDLIRYNNQIAAIQKDILAAERSIKNEAHACHVLASHPVPSILQARLNVANQQFESLSSRGFDYNSLATLFTRTYAILNLFGLIEKKKVSLSMFVPGLDDELGNQLQLSDIEILTFRWDYIKQIFTDPLSYLKSAFPLSNLADIQSIIGKIMDVVLTFQEDAPQIDNPRQLVLETLVRIENRLNDKYEPIDDAAPLKALRNSMNEVLRVYESFAITAKPILQSQFESFGANAYSQDEITGIQTFDSSDDASNPISFGKLKQELKNRFAEVGKPMASANNLLEPLKTVMSEKISSYIPDATKSDIEANWTDFSDRYKESVDTALNSIIEAFQSNIASFDSFFNLAIHNLRYETDFLLRNADHRTLEDVKNLSLGESGDLLSDFPYSDFDISDYIVHVANSLNNFLRIETEPYRADLFESLSDTVSILFDTEIDSAQLNSWSYEVFSSWWEQLQHDIEQTILTPYTNQTVVAIKDWGNNLYNMVISGVKQTCKSLLSNNSLSLKFDDPELWKDGINLSTQIIKAIPSAAKKALRGFIDLPIDLSNVKLPEYSLDTENKFLAVPLYSKKTSDGKSSVDIQLVAHVGQLEVDSTTKTGLFFYPIVKGNTDINIPLGSENQFKLLSDASLNSDDKNDAKKLGFFFYQGSSWKDIQVKPLSDKESVQFGAALKFSRTDTAKNADGPNGRVLLNTSVVDISIKDYPQTVFVSYNCDNKYVQMKGKNKKNDTLFDFGYQGEINDLSITLKLKEMNEFFNKVLSDDIRIPISFSLGYSLQKGFNVDGKLLLDIPFNSEIDCNVVKFSNLTARVGYENGDLTALLKTSLSVTIPGITVSFPEMGIGCSCNLVNEEGGWGDCKVKPQFIFPNGLGIAIDTGAVTGSGLVSWDDEKGRFFGTISLDIMELCSATAWLLFTTKPYLFMGSIFASFNPGIQLGMGFELTGVGGVLGVNRMIELSTVRDSVYDGSLSAVLLGQTPGKDIDKLLANIEQCFPMKEDQIIIGLMAQVSWSRIIKATMGLFIQAPDPVTILIAGDLKVGVAETADNYLSINVCFLGILNPAVGMSFDASLYNSQIVGIELFGDMALRIFWGGDTKGFILSAGGFHPQYTPEPGFGLNPHMKRIGMKLDYKIVKMSMDAYFAITSNTVQFGTEINLNINMVIFSASGYLTFNALFQFCPFYFCVDMSAGVAFKMGSVTLLAVHLQFELSGPAQWHAKGLASCMILLFEAKIDFNYTWGKKQSDSNRLYIDVLKLFEDAFIDDSNWKAISTGLGDNLVEIAPFTADGLVVQPSDKLQFNQSAVPLDTDMQKYGEDLLGDYSRLSLESVQVGNSSFAISSNDEPTPVSIQTSSFAPNMIRRLTDNEKLTAKSYEEMPGGFCLDTDLNIVSASKDSLAVDVNHTEIDTDDLKGLEGKMDLWNKTYKSFAPYQATEQHQAAKSVTRSTNLESQAAYRRTSTGFKRFIKMLDQKKSNKA